MKAIRDNCNKLNILFDKKGYVNSFQENLFDYVTNWNQIEKELNEGDGGELKPKNGNLPKFKSVCSSAALCVNNFAFLKKDIDLSNDVSFLNYNKFKESKFEAKLSTGLKGYSPNLDISLVNDLVIIGVESKFIEILTPKLPNQKRPDKDYGSLDPYYISSKVDYYVDFK